jgi:hypothetical protein
MQDELERLWPIPRIAGALSESRTELLPYTRIQLYRWTNLHGDTFSVCTFVKFPVETKLDLIRNDVYDT